VSEGKLFHLHAPATGSAQRSMVESYCRRHSSVSMQCPI